MILRVIGVGTQRTNIISIFLKEELRYASTDLHRTDRFISNAYMRCVPMTTYDLSKEIFCAFKRWSITNTISQPKLIAIKGVAKCNIVTTQHSTVQFQEY
ncbi:hypothetical protein SFRURICE_018514 [Spodoptera frugiperda]|nr:hypothetical protein SFRURICE_018514 [Spodoptera frugiperda]